MQKEIFNRITRIDYLIRTKATGTPGQLAERLGMSERSVYEYINLMKELGAPIKFNSYRQTYYYETEGSIEISFFPKGENDSNANRKFGT